MSAVNLSNLLNNLKLDEMNVDTKLAEEYLEENKAGFYGNVSNGDDKYVIDSSGNILHNTGLPHGFVNTLLKEQISEIPEKMKKLAVEIEKNTDLFCQLDFLIRKTSFKETKHSIKLITQNLLFVSEGEEICNNMKNSIIITDGTPFFVLGCVMQMFLLQKIPWIIASKEVGVICHLFHKICLKVGLNTMIIFGKDFQKVDYKAYPLIFDGVLPEITGIVTERSDLDSAVDVFLNSDRHPFPVTQIFVQENVYEEFKTAMAWKCALKQDTTKKGMEEIELKCSNAFEYNNKLFILDFAGSLDENKQTDDETNTQIVLVEAYRTVAEVLSLLNKSRRRLCLSVWSDGISEANQIALSVKVPLVWINDCCNFNGPSEISQAIYKRIKFDVKVYASVWYTNLTIKQLMEKRERWLQKTFAERCRIVLEGIRKVDIDNAVEIERKMLHWKVNNFISNDKTFLVQGFNEPNGVTGFRPPTLLSCIDKIVKALINVNAVVVKKSGDPDVNKYLESFMTIEEIPILLCDDQDSEEKETEIVLNFENWFHQTKVIWTNFGTTFAN